VVFGKTNGVTIDLSNIALSSNKGGFAISGNKAGDSSSYSAQTPQKFCPQHVFQQGFH
jgi:hypothetical protein